MKFWNLLIAGIIFIASNNTNAALVSRLDGLAYYDTDANLTWLADANAGAESVFDNGRDTWYGDKDGAMTWAASLNINGITGWRLPRTLQPDESCSSVDVMLYNCTGSEMGNLYYNVLGNTAYPGLPPVESTVITGPFENVMNVFYWSESDFIPDDIYSTYDYSWAFHMGTGEQAGANETYPNFAWAVHDGDVASLSSVPVPAAVWLFGSGLIGLAGFARRNFMYKRSSL